MPIYEYQCLECNTVFDFVVLKASEKFTPTCSECGSTKVKKLVSKVRYMAGPKEDGLASNAEKRLLGSLGGKVSDQTRQEVKELSKKAAKRGKKRFESMMDTGKSENIEY